MIDLDQTSFCETVWWSLQRSNFQISFIGILFLLNVYVLCFPAEVCFPPLYHLLCISVDFQNIRYSRNLKLGINMEWSDGDSEAGTRVWLVVVAAAWTLITIITVMPTGRALAWLYQGVWRYFCSTRNAEFIYQCIAICETFKGSVYLFSWSHQDVIIRGKTIICTQSKREAADKVSVWRGRVNVGRS